jgi:glutathione synthase/RimK-type ligase-like ATP-grasp enzyme
MKLVLANNQTEAFRNFYADISQKVDGGVDYAPYDSLLFYFNTGNQPLGIYSVATQKDLSSYDAVYINGYLRTYELALGVGLGAAFLGVPFVNEELSAGPSLSKLSMHVKLAIAGVSVPRTIGGSKKALLAGASNQTDIPYPLILKRADADRGIDNFKVKDFAEVTQLLEPHDDASLWLLQEFIENDGFYLVSYYGFEPKFCIFRSLEARPDHNEQKAHMFKPAGGANAQLIETGDIPPSILQETEKAVRAMNRQIGSVDCLYDKATNTTYVLEVNYNPQLVTIETFKDVRIQAFTDFLKEL